MITTRICAFFLLLFLVSCSSLEYARYYHPSLQNQGLRSLGWGDGLVTATNEGCIWVQGEGLYIPATVGPVFLPIFPIGLFADKGPWTPTEYRIQLWLIPQKSGKDTFSFKPKDVVLTLDNGVTIKPTMMSRSNSMDDGYKLNSGEPDVNIIVDEVFKTFLSFDYHGSQMKPVALEVKGLSISNGESYDLKYVLTETRKYRYLMSGQTLQGEWKFSSPVRACKQLLP